MRVAFASVALLVTAVPFSPIIARVQRQTVGQRVDYAVAVDVQNADYRGVGAAEVRHGDGDVRRALVHDAANRRREALLAVVSMTM